MHFLSDPQPPDGAPISYEPSSRYVPNHQFNMNFQYQYPGINPNQMWNNPPLVGGEENWNRVFKLVLLCFVSTIGSMGSVFIISSITVMDTFQVRGNAHLMSLAFGHLLVSILVLPASAIAIMANQSNNDSICHFQWCVTLICLLVTVLSYMCLAMDNYFTINCTMLNYRNCCTKCRVGFLVVLVWLCAAAIPYLQHFQQWGPNFCPKRRHWKISLDYHPYLLGFIILCTLLTLLYFTRSIFQYKAYKFQQENSSSSLPPDVANFILTDGYLLKPNMIVYLISLAMWLPLIATMVIDSINPVPQKYLDTVWYIALGNSCGFSYMYAATNRDFRETFNKLFYYCCCKSHVTFTRKGAALRRTLANESLGLRVHIIPGLNIYAQRRAESNYANTQGSYGGRGFGAFGGGSAGGGSGGFFNRNSGPRGCEL